MSNSVTYVPADETVVLDQYALREAESRRDTGIRSRRQAPKLEPLSSEDIAEVLYIHNYLRRLEPASDMEYMIWNSYLADMATEWSSKCIWGHGQPFRNGSTVPFDPIGQNLYLSMGTTVNITFLSLRWYSEKPYYNFNNATCQKNQMCGHYTQVVWSLSREIGCGKYLCENATDAETDEVYRKAWIFACNYGPAGNYNGITPYRLGEPCQLCVSGQMWCDRETPRGLCRRDCSQNSNNCECKASCRNQGALNSSLCRCKCADGWGDLDCGMPCCDYSTYCGKQWPRYACNDRNYGGLIRSFCFLTCGLCLDSVGNRSQSPAPSTCPFSASTTNSYSLTTTSPLTFPTSPGTDQTTSQTNLYTSSTELTRSSTSPLPLPEISSSSPTPVPATASSPTSSSSQVSPTTSSSVVTSTRVTVPRVTTFLPATPVLTPRQSIPQASDPATKLPYTPMISSSETKSTVPNSVSDEGTSNGDVNPTAANQSLMLIIVLATVAAIIVLVVIGVIIMIILCQRMKRQTQMSRQLETSFNELRPVTSDPASLTAASAPIPPENPAFKDHASIMKNPYLPENMVHFYPHQAPNQIMHAGLITTA